MTQTDSQIDAPPARAGEVEFPQRLTWRQGLQALLRVALGVVALIISIAITDSVIRIAMGCLFPIMVLSAWELLCRRYSFHRGGITRRSLFTKRVQWYDVAGLTVEDGGLLVHTVRGQMFIPAQKEFLARSASTLLRCWRKKLRSTGRRVVPNPMPRTSGILLIVVVIMGPCLWVLLLLAYIMDVWRKGARWKLTSKKLIFYRYGRPDVCWRDAIYLRFKTVSDGSFTGRCGGIELGTIEGTSKVYIPLGLQRHFVRLMIRLCPSVLIVDEDGKSIFPKFARDRDALAARLQEMILRQSRANLRPMIGYLVAAGVMLVAAGVLRNHSDWFILPLLCSVAVVFLGLSFAWAYYVDRGRGRRMLEGLYRSEVEWQR